MKTIKISSVKKFALLFVLLLFSATMQKIHAQELNIGFRCGFNAMASLFYEPSLNGEELLEKAYTNRVGYTATVFTRINLNRFFVQPELNWNIYKYSLAFNIYVDETSNRLDYDCDLDAHVSCVSGSVAIGYNIVRSRPFSLAIMLGPSYKYIYSTEYDLNQQTYWGNTPDYTLGGWLGFSVCVSKIHFDIRYEMNFPYNDLRFSSLKNIPDNLKDVFVHKNESILGFSFGVIL